VEKAFGDLPNLERLIVNKNYLKEFPKITKFKSLKHFAADHNLLLVPTFLSKIAGMQLNSLSIKHNPLVDKYGKLYVR
jgi:Leucine-rich repeat (LRR) protein